MQSGKKFDSFQIVVGVYFFVVIIAMFYDPCNFAQYLGAIGSVLVLGWSMFITYKHEAINVKAYNQKISDDESKVYLINPDRASYIVTLKKVTLVIDGVEKVLPVFPTDMGDLLSNECSINEWPKRYMAKSGERKDLFLIHWGNYYQDHPEVKNNPNSKIILYFSVQDEILQKLEVYNN